VHLRDVFVLNRRGFNLARGAMLAAVLVPLIVVGVLPGEQKYFLSAIFGALFVRSATLAALTATGCLGPRQSRRPARC
jgi:hypothetical protein